MSQQFYSQKPKSSEADIVFEMLQTQGQPQHYNNLVEEVLNRLGLSQEPQRIAAVLTQINLDSRFAYVGQGEWGLKAWVPQRPSRRLPSLAVANKVEFHDTEEKPDLDLIPEKQTADGLDDIDLDLDDDEMLELDDVFEEELDEEASEDVEDGRENNWE